MRICDVTTDDVDAAADLIVRAFGPVPAAHAARRRHTIAARAARHRTLGVRDGDRLVAAASILDMTQYWHGRAVPLAGVSGVVVAPEDRGRGVGALVMRATLERAAGRGAPLSMLYPATTAFYRGLGYEIAGPMNSYTFPIARLRSLAPRGGPQVPLRRAGAADTAEVAEVLGRVHTAGGHCGPTVRALDDAPWWLNADDAFTYLADDGVLAYTWSGGDIEVQCLAAGSAATLRALWAVVASNETIADTVHAVLAPDDPVFWLTGFPVGAPLRSYRWMLRLLDVPAAMAARGFPPGVSLRTTVTVTDAELPGNAATWRLTVADGAGHAERVPADPHAVHLDASGLAALYAGTPIGTLRLTGALTGGDADHDARLGAAFACRTFALDHF